MNKRKLDIAIISDVHLGTYGCHAKELLKYLKGIEPGILILNGDFIDIWQFKKRYFPQEHLQIIQAILKMATNGTKVYYITGNHDDMLRRYSDFSTGNIHLRDKLILQLNGKKYWIFHGDVFDLINNFSPFLSKTGGKGYDLLIRVNRLINKIRTRFGKPNMSFAHKVKSRVKKAVKFISNFEDTAIKLAAEQDYDFVICGHIHQPTIREVKKNGKQIRYLNAGDWVENLTSLEYRYGNWTLYRYDETDYTYNNPKLYVKDQINQTDDAPVADWTLPQDILDGIFASRRRV